MLFLVLGPDQCSKLWFTYTFKGELSTDSANGTILSKSIKMSKCRMYGTAARVMNTLNLSPTTLQEVDLPPSMDCCPLILA